MTKLWVFGLEFVVLGVVANIVAHYLVKYFEGLEVERDLVTEPGRSG